MPAIFFRAGGMLRDRTARFHYDKGAVMKVYYEKDADLNTVKEC